MTSILSQRRLSWRWWTALLLTAVCAAAIGYQQVARQSHAADPEKPLRFIFITPCVDEFFFNPVKQGMRDAAAMLGVKTEFIGTADVDIPAQVDMVRKAIADGYDGIALNIIDPVAFDEVTQLARNKGIPLVAFNVDDHATPNARLSAVCQNLYQAGRNAGQAAAPSIRDRSKVLLTEHSAGISALDDRLRGIQEILKPKGVTWEVVITGVTAEASEQVITEALKRHPEIKAVLCTGQADTEGAGLAVEKNFANRGYFVGGFDLSPQTLRLLKAGVIQFTIDQQPYAQGFYPVVQLTLFRRYGIKPASLDAGATILRPSDADTVLELTRRGYR